MSQSKDSTKGYSVCPICRKPSQASFKPFCSRRCADVDLHRWLGEGYRIPTDEPPESGGIPGDEPSDDGTI